MPAEPGGRAGGQEGPLSPGLTGGDPGQQGLVPPLHHVPPVLRLVQMKISQTHHSLIHQLSLDKCMLTVLHALHFEKTFYALRLLGYLISNWMFLLILKNKDPEEQTVAERTALALHGPISGVPTAVTKFP